jgi:hypothetical protein
MTIILASVDLAAIKDTEAYQGAYGIALSIHQKDHDQRAVDFKDCRQCKDGFALLLTANLRGKA